jgi:hypothetical protein
MPGIRPNLNEITRDDHGIAMSRAFTAMLLENTDRHADARPGFYALR